MLSAGDFTAEQEYFNRKRSLINRHVLGNGIVCGLKVNKGSQSDLINISQGVAIDPCGREIVVPDVQTISVWRYIPQAKEIVYQKDKSYIFYLGLDYVEHGEELAFSLAAADSQSNLAAEHNRIHEGFKFSLIQENKVEQYSQIPVWYRSTVIYKDKRIQIERAAPEYVATDETFKVYIKLTITDSKTDLASAWTIRQRLTGCFSVNEPGNPTMETKFYPTSGGNTQVFMCTHELRAGRETGSGKIQTIEVLEDTTVKGIVAGTDSVFTAVRGSVAEYTANSLIPANPECPKDCSSCKDVYLAKLTLKCTGENGSSFSVEKIENIPFHLKGGVYNNQMIFDLVKQLEESERLQRDDLKTTLTNEILNNAKKDKIPEISTGIVPFKNIQPGKDYYSAEISTGLGNVAFLVDLGFDMPDSNEEFFGDVGFFTGSEKFKDKYPNIVMGAIMNPSRGSFVIGLRLKTAEPACEKVIIRWWAQRLDRET